MLISILKRKLNYPGLEPSPYGLTGPIGFDFGYFIKLKYYKNLDTFEIFSVYFPSNGETYCDHL